MTRKLAMIQFYGYDKCSTCKKAEKILVAGKKTFVKTDITTNPPSPATLKAALSQGYVLNDLFNKSGVLYREMNMKDKIKTLTEAQALELLSQNGRLVKRPIVTDGKRVSVGLVESNFKKLWDSII